MLLRRRLSLRTTLLTLLVGLLILTVVSLAGLFDVNTSRSVAELEARYFRTISLAISGEVAAFLDPALPILQELSAGAQHGRVPVEDLDRLGEELVERLRYRKPLAWLSYGEQTTGRFVGAWRRADGAIVLNRSAPDVDGGRPFEMEVTDDGRQIPFFRELRPGYDPRQQGWYRQAVASAGPIWTDPFEFNEGAMGITAALAVRAPGSAEPRGVFTADFFLEDVSRFLTGLADGQNAQIVVLTGDGTVVATSSTWPEERSAPILATALRALPTSLGGLDPDTAAILTVQQASVPYIAAFQPFSVGGLDWVAGVLVPENEFLQAANDNRRNALGLGLLLLTAAVALGSLVAHRIASPLRVIARDLEQVGRFRLSAEPSPTSFVREVAVVSDSIDRMKASLRSFGHYVPTQLVQELLASGHEAQLGGEDRALTILFSDIEGFTRVSEQLEPGRLVEHLGAYLQAMTSVFHEHDGTIDKFIGDGILALFNAPRDVPDHPTKGCRAALRAQQCLEQLRPVWEAAGKPAFRTRIGLHTGRALVGNIGTPDRFAYTVVGDAVNLASRLEDLNRLYGTGILASHEVREAAGPDFEWRVIDRVAVVGRTGWTLVNELLGERGQVAPGVLRARDVYEQGLVAYFAGRFTAAAAGFRAAAETLPADRAAEVMARRAEVLERDAPPPTWDGTFLQTTKS
ncbi:MAG: hypothetical protein H0V51_12135 [Chloroflexi bacterium]|nr:hypothetical protein [Chloroflexota bacterium]